MTQTGSMGLISAAFAAAPQAVHHMMGILAPLHKPTPAGLRVLDAGIRVRTAGFVLEIINRARSAGSASILADCGARLGRGLWSRLFFQDMFTTEAGSTTWRWRRREWMGLWFGHHDKVMLRKRCALVGRDLQRQAPGAKVVKRI
jgi:hypothetical protein